ncbi:hypothetical protein K438DRAFT_1770440 [Mycena galopus ATCC 62051]|nr:hypothetical protein K438DRAFT_1770440 [Mycena galopus ATCC 62051]
MPQPVSPWLSKDVITSNLGLFDGFAASQQRGSKELTLFSPTIHVVAKVAWPLVGNVPVTPAHMADYLKMQNLHWSCFCAMHAGLGPDGLPCRILTWPQEVTLAVCHFAEPRCQFYLNLMKIAQSCTLKQEYIPLGQQGQEPLHDTLLHRYLFGQEPPSPTDLHLTGYLGEPQGATQIGIIMVVTDAAKFLSKYLVQNTSVAAQTEPVADIFKSCNIDQMFLFMQLAGGYTVDKKLFERTVHFCKECEHWYLATVKAHKCVHM